MDQHREQAARIRAGGKGLDYEEMALEAMARSWDHAADGNAECSALAISDALVWATLHAARCTQAVARKVG